MSEIINPYIEKQGDLLKITPAGERYLENLVTSTSKNVYAFTHNAPPKMVAAAMARVSRSPDGIREIYLNEMAGDPDRADALIARVLADYGDDSVAQLHGIHFVVENCSKFATKHIEWARIGTAYLERSSRYIFFDQKDAHGNFRYMTPPGLPQDIQTRFKASLDLIFTLYSEIVRGITDYLRKTTSPPDQSPKSISAWKASTRAQACDAARGSLPLATTTAVGVYASTQAIESIIYHLMSQPQVECQQIGLQILEEVRKVAAPFFLRTDVPERGGAIVAHRIGVRKAFQRLAQLIPSSLYQGSDPVVLLDHFPKNELDILADMLMPHTHLQTQQLQEYIRVFWSDEEKIEAFRLYFGERLNRRHKPGRALEWPHIKAEVVMSYAGFCDLQRQRMVDTIEWQGSTPDLGYETPNIISKAGFEAEYDKCFELSEKLFTTLKKMGHEDASEYATLYGHKMRHRVAFNARGAFHYLELRSAPQGHPEYRKITQLLYEHFCEAFPLTGKAMIFVNKNEDPGLTRLAGELAKQAKLSLLGYTPGEEE